MYTDVKNEMTEYYRKYDMIDYQGKYDVGIRDEAERIKFKDRYMKIIDEMEEFYKQNPDTPVCLLKSRIHTFMAENSEPVIFPSNPFFFEIGLNQSHSWGLWNSTPASWVYNTLSDELLKTNLELREAEENFSPYFDRKTNNLCSIFAPFDIDHNTIGYTKIFKVGIRGLIEEASLKIQEFKEGTDEYNYCQAIKESLEALIKISYKFSEKAEIMLLECSDKKQKAYLERIRETAKIIPENPPKTFYEGLSMLLFLREVMSTMENIGISHLGHVDRLLGDLYENDLKNGRITEEEARELISIWMLPTDIKFDLHNNQWPETSTCVQLGGCDEKGKAVFNDVTKMFIEEHHKLNLVNPKLNCRFSKNSDREYLKLIGRSVIKGHNTFALINDDLIIPSLQKSGVALEDARLFVNGGCQETMIEGKGHTEGAGMYVSMLRLLDAFLREDKTLPILKPIDCADTYEEFYEKFLSYLDNFFCIMTNQRNLRQSILKNAFSCPMFSSTQEGCIENGRDYSKGGAKYNFSTVALVGLANVVDSLYSLKTFVYDKKHLGLKDFIKILEKNWEGEELFHEEVISLSKYGHDEKEVDLIADRFLKDISSVIKSKLNERGGAYLPSTFVYEYNRTFAPHLRATPDGRYNYDYMAAGCSPSLLKRIEDITVPIKSMSNIDFTVLGGGISVLDMMLPISKGFNEDIFASFIKTCSHYNSVTIQPNAVSKEELIDAKKNPQNHKNLIVRICGLSAYFVSLSEEVQDEIINRNYYIA